MGKLKKATDKQLKIEEKKQSNALDLMSTKVKFVSDEIKKFKDYKNEIINEHKDGLEEFRAETKQQKLDLQKDFKTEMSNLSKDTAKLKDNFVKVMDLLKEKLVTKQSFESNNKVIETALADLVEKTKDLDKIKFTYFSKMKVNKQLDGLQGDMGKLKRDYSGTQHKVEELTKSQDEIASFRKTAETEFVKDSTFASKFKEVEDLKEKILVLEAQMAKASEQSSSAVDINLFNNEVEDIRQRLSSISEFEAKLNNYAPREELGAQKTVLSKVENKYDSLASELAALKVVAAENKQLRSDVDKLKLELEKSQHEINKNATMVEMLRSTSSTVKIKGAVKAEEVKTKADEQSLADIALEDNNEPGIFKRAFKGISDFFLEEDSEDSFLNFEETPEIKKEYKVSESSNIVYTPRENVPAISDTKFVNEIEKMFDEADNDVELNVKIDSPSEPGLLSKVKTGVVNFFFEEVDQDEEFVFQGEEIGKEDEASLSEPDEMPKVEIIEDENFESKSDKKPGNKKKATNTKVAPGKKSEKKVHYMSSRRPRIFDEMQENEPEDELSDIEDLSKPKKRARKASVTGDSSEEYVYYPEDYFY